MSEDTLTFLTRRGGTKLFYDENKNMHISQKAGNKKYGLVLPLVNQENQPVSKVVFEQDRYKKALFILKHVHFLGRAHLVIKIV